MLESTGGGLDQSAATRKRRHCGYVGDGCLTSGRGVIFPDSYRAREGLQHLLAGWCDPGWNGSRLTLELKNVRQLHWVGIYPGLRIGQMKFMRMDSTPLASYADVGRYNGDVTVTSSRG
jgi:deoxycytidine triphosphate deaminase